MWGVRKLRRCDMDGEEENDSEEHVTIDIAVHMPKLEVVGLGSATLRSAMVR